MKKKEVESYFDRWATDYKKLPDEKSFHIRQIAKIINSNFKKSTRNVLDLGIGNGRLILSLSSKKDYYGIDISEKQIKIAEKKAKIRKISLRCIKHDLEKSIPFPTNSLDAVISNASIHHIKNKSHLFREVHRILKPNCIFIYFDFYFKDYKKSIKNKGVARSSLFLQSIRKEGKFIPKKLIDTHPCEYHIAPTKIVEILRKVGFKSSELIQTPYPKFVGFRSYK